MRNRIEVIHGVNLDQIGRRDPDQYGTLTFDELQYRIEAYAADLDLQVRFFQTNHEGALVEHLHLLEGIADAIVINPGAWTHYAWAIRDALEITGLPAVEVHLSDVQRREDFRKVSVIADLCVQTISGQGAEGYREALARCRRELQDQA